MDRLVKLASAHGYVVTCYHRHNNVKLVEWYEILVGAIPFVGPTFQDACHAATEFVEALEAEYIADTKAESKPIPKRVRAQAINSWLPPEPGHEYEIGYDGKITPTNETAKQWLARVMDELETE